MLTREVAGQLIQLSIEELNADRDQGAKIAISDDLLLNGEGSPLDSLDFVNFALALEDRLQQHGGITLDLFEESKGDKSFTVSTLAEYLAAVAAPARTA